MEIQYTVIGSSLGRVLVARTDRGICAVYPGDTDAALERQFAVEFPQRRAPQGGDAIPRGAPGARCARQGREATAALDVNGTDFQRLVWAALARIPAGETRTYGEVAKSIGREGSARAVARACATNNVAVLVPCHRVIRGDGGMGGYRWGIERKQALLAREGGAA